MVQSSHAVDQTMQWVKKLKGATLVYNDYYLFYSLFKIPLQLIALCTKKTNSNNDGKYKPLPTISYFQIVTLCLPCIQSRFFLSWHPRQLQHQQEGTRILHQATTFHSDHLGQLSDGGHSCLEVNSSIRMRKEYCSRQHS